MDPRRERDACGVGFVADARGRASHAIVASALRALARVRHRGALAADARTGDGAGLLVPLPRPFLARVAAQAGSVEPPARLGLAMCFLDGRPGWQGYSGMATGRRIVEDGFGAEGIEVLAWRDVPVRPEALGAEARRTLPRIAQALIAPTARRGAEELERRAFRGRRRAEHVGRAAGASLYLASASFATVTYKALCAADHLASFYADLDDPDFSAPFAVFHQRYSTNTAPAWELAQPFRMLCHNGEINTIEGNVRAMRAREGRLGGDLGADELLRPVVDDSGSDSAILDEALELLVRGGRDVRQALSMLVPPAWERSVDMDDEVRSFFRYAAGLIEPWDGPAALVFTDGIRVGATLDRNGLRPARYAICEDGLVACASEAGAVDVHGHGRVRRGKLGPGQMICVDPEHGVLLDGAIKRSIATARPYADWLGTRRAGSVGSAEITPPEDLQQRQVAFGFTKEEVTVVLRPMASAGHEPTSSMGDDTAIPPLAERVRPVTSFLRQRFAQVTNPPIDPLRERDVMSLRVLLGPRAPLLEDGPDAAALVELPTFALYPDAFARLGERLGTQELDATFPVADGPGGLARACRRLGDEACAAIASGVEALIVGDGMIGPDRAPVPSVLAVGAVHQRLVAEGLRALVALLADAGDVRDAHDAACLLGYGGEAVCPRTAFETIAALAEEGRLDFSRPSPGEALERFRRSLEDGVLKVMSKMGIASVDAYRGAQLFEALGLGADVVGLCLTGTPSPLGGLSLDDLGAAVLQRHHDAYGRRRPLENPGFVKHRAGGDFHANDPEVVRALHAVAEARDDDAIAAHALRRAVRGGGRGEYRRFVELATNHPPAEPRDLLDLAPARPPIPIDEVEPVEAILPRFSSGAMSHGALSAEAHETLALGMSSIGGKANTGEGGEDRARYRDARNSAIKQVASGRFGVTPEYCAFADELQIKMAQGSKPGEGGQLPGTKVTEEIARLRHTPPGVALISPPPHHDIYSIEDLAQLVFDLKQVNPRADVSVKLVSTVGVGTIAAGVVKALADVVHISGCDGGTGASPLSSIKNAGMPWEVGLVETQAALVASGLRSRVRLRVDGGFKTGRDVAVAALLGADEYSFGTAALLALGCIMVRTCHRDTCPVGIASQRPELRAKFAGTPEMVASYLVHVAEEVREIFATLGLRTLADAVGRSDLIRPRDHGTPVDVAMLLGSPRGRHEPGTRTRPASALGDRLHDEALPVLNEGSIGELAYRISTSDRAVGARLGGAVALAYGDRRPPGRIRATFEGPAGQSFGAFLAEGVELDLTGEANDYVGKGMAGGRIVVRPPEAESSPTLLGNTVLYGATGGQLFCAGAAGERFAVRNSGAVAVVEGVGDHALEYMTGGAVVVLGEVGANLAAGMSGGEAYVWDPRGAVRDRVNGQLVELRAPAPGQLPSLRRLVERHARATGSRRARTLLEGWERASTAFTRIVPKAEVALIEGALEGGASA